MLFRSALAGQIGGAKLADGLYRLRGKDLAIVANTGDDYEQVGLSFSPDIDTLLYTLSGIASDSAGWEPAGETRESAGERERHEPLAVHGNANRPRGRRILAGCPKQATEPARLVRKGDGDDDDRSDGGLEEACRLGNGRERVQARPDLLVVAEDVVRDLEDAEGRNACREPRQAHQREPDDQRVDAAHACREDERAEIADLVVTQERDEVRHDRRLLGDRDGQHAGRPGTDGHEADVSEDRKSTRLNSSH